MGQLDASIVTLTYAPLEREFHVSPAAVQWVSLSYLLTLVALLAPVGRSSDQHGRKLAYLRGFVVFGAASALCGLSPSLGVLIGARVVQGGGAALLQANSVALITDAAPAARLRAALGFQAAAQAVGLALGPTVGGLIVSTVGWRWIFAINVPIAVLAVVAGVLLLPRTVRRSPQAPTDVVGAGLLAGASIALLLALSILGGIPMPAWVVPALIVASLAMVGLLVRHQDKVERPVISRRVIRSPGAPANLGAAMAAYLVLFGPLVLVPAVLEAKGVGPLRVGLILTALPAGFALAATVGGGVMPRGWGDRSRSVTGLLVAATALGAALALPFTPGWIAAVLAILGLGLGVMTPANNAALMRAVPADTTASAGGLLNMSRSFGTALGISGMTLALHISGVRLAQALLLGAVGVGLLLVSAAWASRSVAGRRKPGGLSAP
jgi:MFS family permease